MNETYYLSIWGVNVMDKRGKKWGKFSIAIWWIKWVDYIQFSFAWWLISSTNNTDYFHAHVWMINNAFDEQSQSVSTRLQQLVTQSLQTKTKSGHIIPDYMIQPDRAQIPPDNSKISSH